MGKKHIILYAFGWLYIIFFLLTIHSIVNDEVKKNEKRCENPEKCDKSCKYYDDCLFKN